MTMMCMQEMVARHTILMRVSSVHLALPRPGYGRSLVWPQSLPIGLRAPQPQILLFGCVRLALAFIRCARLVFSCA